MATLSNAEMEQITHDNIIFSWGIKDVLAAKSKYPSHGEGVFIYDTDGKKYIDMSSQAVCSNLGHSCPQSVIDAVTEQMQAMPFMFGDTLISQVRARYSKALAEFVPGNINSFLFLSSGAEANEQAMRIAQRVTGRQKIFSAHRSYHGGSGGTISLTGDMRRHFSPAMPGHIKFLDPNPYSFSWGKTTEEVVELSLATLRAQVMSENGHSIAALFLESVVGTNGYIRYPEGYMEGVRALCDEFGIMMVCDEVMTGFGRTGKPFGFMNYDIQPDMITMAKGITSAYLPLSGVGLSDHVHDKIREMPLGGGSTYVAHPTVLACAEQVLKIVSEPKFLQHVNDMNVVLHEHFEDLKSKNPCIKETRALGLFGAIEFAGEVNGFRGTMHKPDPTMQEFRFKLMDNGLFTFSAGAHIAITPPLVIKPEEIAYGMDIIDKTIKQMGW